MRQIASEPGLRLQLLVTGAHLSPKFGETLQEILADGFRPDAKVDMQLADESPVGIATAMARGLEGMAKALTELAPDIVVILGDRYEIFAAAQAAMLLGLPIAHIHGGEATEGAWDQSIRHSITKLAHVHFTAAEEYRTRVIQLGEQPDCVFNVGSMAIDCLANFESLSRAQINLRLGIEADQPYFLVTYHPVTLSDDLGRAGFEALVTALEAFGNHAIVVTGVNADLGFEEFYRAVQNWAASSKSHVKYLPSLGQELYLSAMRYCDAVIGNSSSGILEAPALGIPSVNIGDRQKGRIRAASVIDTGEIADDVRAAISRALSPHFRALASQSTYPFGKPGSAKRISARLMDLDLRKLVTKKFYDLPLQVSR